MAAILDSLFQLRVGARLTLAVSLLAVSQSFVLLADEKAGTDEPAKKDGSNQAPSGPWRVFGRVTDGEGQPLAGVEIWVHTGYATFFRRATAISGADGRYELDLNSTHMSFFPRTKAPAAILLSAHKERYFEENLNRQGNCKVAPEVLDEQDLKEWNVDKDRLLQPGRLLELNFVMRPAGSVAGTLVDEEGKPLVGYSVSLTGATLPPGSSVMDSVHTDEHGHFALEDIPTTFRFQFAVRKADPKPPFDDSWASAALAFDRHETEDLRVRFGEREIQVRDLVLRVAGPGVHERTATRIAGNVGLLDLTVDDAADVLEKTEKRLVVRSAVLTLRNTSRPDTSRSLVTDSIPASLAHESTTRLTRGRPNRAGEFVISFENPRDFQLERGKHQVIFQVVVGTSQKPIRARIFKQLEIEQGRYAIPVKITPELIDDSRVSLTFVSIQPDHDAWVKAFFDEGKGTQYRGIWTSDGDVMPAIPLAPPGKD